MWKELAPLRQLSRTAAWSTRQRPAALSPAQTQASRPFTTVPARRAQPQDEEDHYHDRNKLQPQRTESSQSATTDEVAGSGAAFDPSKTSPESEIGESQEESKRKGERRDPLTVSGADKNVGGARDPMEGGAQKNVDKDQHSARGAPIKNRQRK
ncbi:hypothetical protein BDV18DRAFT_29934 [Aspergillus unguis]